MISIQNIGFHCEKTKPKMNSNSIQTSASVDMAQLQFIYLFIYRDQLRGMWFCNAKSLNYIFTPHTDTRHEINVNTIRSIWADNWMHDQVHNDIQMSFTHIHAYWTAGELRITFLLSDHGIIYHSPRLIRPKTQRNASSVTIKEKPIEFRSLERGDSWCIFKFRQIIL